MNIDEGSRDPNSDDGNDWGDENDDGWGDDDEDAMPG